jgi:hypothetical protein
MAKRWLARLVLLALSTAVALLGLEIAIRATGLDHPLCWEPDPHVGWWHIPGSRMHWTSEGDGWVEINSLGMRDVERKVEKTPGVLRIAVFGDSMTEGVQVNLDQTYTQQLERRLKDRGIAAEVLNFGLNGYSPLSGYLLYDKVGKAFQPDIVIHAVFLDNDIPDGDPALAAGQVGAPFVIPGSGPKLAIDHSRSEASYRDYHTEPLYTLRRWSATYRTVSAVRSNWKARKRAEGGLRETAGIPKRYLLYETPLADQWEAAWHTYERILDAFAADVQAAGSRFVLMSVPAGQVVNQDAWQRVMSENPAMQSRQWSLSGPEERFASLAASRQLPLIQPLAEFRRRADGDPLFFNGTGHMTPRGHQAAADVMAEYLMSHGLLKGHGLAK